MTSLSPSSPVSKFLMLFEYLGLLLVIAFVQMVIPFPPAYWVIYGGLGICFVSRLYSLYIRHRFSVSVRSQESNHLQWTGFELGFLIAMGFCVDFCSRYIWTFGLSDDQTLLYATNFMVFNSLLTGLACLLVIFQGIPLLSHRLKLHFSILSVEA